MHTHADVNETRPETLGRTIPWAGFYDKLVNIVSWGKARKLRAQIADKVPCKRGDKVLDVGCGTGDQAILVKHLVGDSGEVYGSDASPKMIEIAQNKAEISNIDVNFQVDLIENISHSDASFDVVMNSLVMHHLPGALKSIGVNEFYRVLKPGGSVYIVDMEPDGGGSPFQRFTDLMIHLHGGRKKLRNNVQQLRPLLEEAGFKDIIVGRVNRQFAYISAKKQNNPV